MNFKVNITLLTLLLLGAIVQLADAVPKRKLKYCHLDQMFECMMEPLWVFTAQHNGTGIPAEDDDFENFCFNIHDIVPYCLRKYSSRCFSPIAREALDKTLIRTFQQSMDKFCTPGGELRERFLRHSKCLISHVKLAPEYRSECVRNLQASMEWNDVISKREKTTSLSSQVRDICCIYQPWENCIVRQLEENCGGTEAGTIIKDLIYHGSAMLIPHLCNHQRYNPNSPTNECDYSKYQPPGDFIPQGISSKSLFSYIFSYSCPNVGFGIFPSRDF